MVAATQVSSCTPICTGADAGQRSPVLRQPSAWPACTACQAPAAVVRAGVAGVAAVPPCASPSAPSGSTSLSAPSLSPAAQAEQACTVTLPRRRHSSTHTPSTHALAARMTASCILQVQVQVHAPGTKQRGRERGFECAPRQPSPPGTKRWRGLRPALCPGCSRSRRAGRTCRAAARTASCGPAR